MPCRVSISIPGLHTFSAGFILPLCDNPKCPPMLTSVLGGKLLHLRTRTIEPFLLKTSCVYSEHPAWEFCEFRDSVAFTAPAHSPVCPKSGQRQAVALCSPWWQITGPQGLSLLCSASVCPWPSGLQNCTCWGALLLRLSREFVSPSSKSVRKGLRSGSVSLKPSYFFQCLCWQRRVELQLFLGFGCSLCNVYCVCL